MRVLGPVDETNMEPLLGSLQASRGETINNSHMMRAMRGKQAWRGARGRDVVSV